MAKKVVMTDEEWRMKLSGLAYEVTRRSGTELPFSGEYYRHNEEGVYRCVCCGTELFNSGAKFESGTGWPSFHVPMAEENVKTQIDRSHGMVRDELRCSSCDAHLGHVFSGGPVPTDRHYCVNSAALVFEAADKGVSGKAAESKS